MVPNNDFYELFAADAKFNELIKKKRKVSFVLFSISMALFFSIPLISSYAPNFFKSQFIGQVNMGLAYLIFQYIAGGLIAWKYAKSFGEIDIETQKLLSSMTGNK